jgi:hypothetical protein
MSSAFYDSIIKEVEYVGPDGHPGVCIMMWHVTASIV